MKQVEFDIELVKKIQSGEIKGGVLTRSGMNVRFLGEFNDDVYPLVFVITINGKEYIQTHSKDGRYSIRQSNNSDLIIEIEEPKQEYQFKPFDKVLVRNSSNQMWHPNFYAMTDGLLFYTTDSQNWCQCIPYEGNQELVGTTNKPKED